MQVEVLYVSIREGVSRKTGERYRMAEAECVFYSVDPDTGEVRPVTGAMTLPKGQEELKSGRYDAVLAFRRDFQTGRIFAGIAKLAPLADSVKAPRAA